MPLTARWTLPTWADAEAAVAPAITAGALSSPLGMTTDSLVGDAMIQPSDVVTTPPPADVVESFSCSGCRASHIAPDMLIDLRPLSAAVRAQLGVDPALDWLCTGCLGTAFNLGQVSHYGLFVEYGAPASALEWASEHTERFPYPAGSPAAADAFALAAGLLTQVPSPG